MGTVRIRSTVKKSVYEYPGMRKEDAAEKILEHLSLFACDVMPDPKVADKNRKLDGTGFLVAPLDFSTVIAEWVENPGDKDEKVEPLAVPKAPQ